MVDFFNQLQATSSFFRIFLISWRGKRPFFMNRPRTFAWKEPLPIAPPLPPGKLDNNLSPRVGDFAQKNYPRPKLPGGDPRGYTWYFHNVNNKIYYNDITFHTIITFPCFFSFPQFSFIPYWLYFWPLSSFYPGAHLRAFIRGFTLGSG